MASAVLPPCHGCIARGPRPILQRGGWDGASSAVASSSPYSFSQRFSAAPWNSHGRPCRQRGSNKKLYSNNNREESAFSPTLSLAELHWARGRRFSGTWIVRAAGRDLPEGARVVEDSPPPASPLQTAGSVVLTGAITFLLLRAFKKRVERGRELRLRSRGETKPQEDRVRALEPPKAAGSASASGQEAAGGQKPAEKPSVFAALQGAVLAGLIAFFCWELTQQVQDKLELQTLSSQYSIRQITVTVRTIIIGVCYLGTFVFGFNSIGLFLYTMQLALGLDSDSEASSAKASPSSTRDAPPSSSADIQTADDENKDDGSTS